MASEPSPYRRDLLTIPYILFTIKLVSLMSNL